ncbi:MAG: NAD(+) synthase [Candidatus Tantalella remota]|nr:NAD(+) synthase [Candidatus Tantalella remota]
MSEYIIPQNEVPVVHDELVAGIRNYMKSHGFKKALIGLSGGIDSALTCALAAEAVGSGNVMGIAMPSKYSSIESEQYARRLAENLGVEYKIVPIGDIYESYLDLLDEDLEGDEKTDIEIYHQNIQARIRGNILMAFSNRFGYFVLATGNRSEAMMGYCTLYGDTVGGLAVLSSVLKAGVYQLSEYINRDKEIIPRDIIDRVPSAELKPGQADHDFLPPYDILDSILYYHLDENCTAGELEKKGFDPDVVKEVLAAIDRTEYKRRQCPPGIKLTGHVKK